MKAPTITLLGPKRLWIIIVNIIIIIIVVVVVVVAVRIPQNWAEPEECGRRRANIGWSEPRLPNSDLRLALGARAFSATREEGKNHVAT